MKTRAVRLHGAMDLRVDEFELPPLKADEMLVKIVCDSVCMSSHKLAKLGFDHKRVPPTAKDHPPIIGHELAGDIVDVGSHLEGRYYPGQRFTIQPSINYNGSPYTPGFAYEYCGGDSTYCILPEEVFSTDSFIVYEGEAYYEAALAEPLACSIGAYNSCYHTDSGAYTHIMGTRENGTLAFIAGAGPMGLGAVATALGRDKNPRLLVVTDIDETRLRRAEELFCSENTQKTSNTELVFVNTKDMDDPASYLRELTGNVGFDDVLCFAPVPAVVELASAILGYDGCLNFFAGPTDKNFSASINFYDVHYNAAHVLGSVGGTTDDMREVLALAAQGRINPAIMITHIGGLGVVPDTVCNLPSIPGGKKLIYTHVDIPLIALDELRTKESEDARFGELADIVEANNMLWSAKAERFLLANW